MKSRACGQAASGACGTYSQWYQLLYGNMQYSSQSKQPFTGLGGGSGQWGAGSAGTFPSS